jgi:hypothetical protein
MCDAGDPLPITLQRCQSCGSEGRIIRVRHHQWREPEEIDCGECPDCEGTGGELIATQPVTEQEIMENL